VTLTLYGIPNCDTVKKARGWLNSAGIPHRFHNYKVDGIDSADLVRWCAALGWETVLNRAGTTFRNLPEADKVGLDAATAIRLMQAQPSMVKRPILEGDGKLLAGFAPERYAMAFGRQS
jgi:arsenate reductase